MVGKQYIRLYTRRYSYELELKRKITIIAGKSGTGKTTLANLVISSKKHTGVVNKSSLPLKVLSTVEVEANIFTIKNSKESIVVIDENTAGLRSDNFIDTVNKSDNYFLIITREKLSNLPYAVDSVCEVVTDKNNKHTLKQLYDRASGNTSNLKEKVDYIVCEDSKSGFIFFKLLDTNGNRVYSAIEGKTQLIEVARELSKRGKTAIICDGSAFGAEIQDALVHGIKLDMCIYAPESFEFILLNSEIFKHDEIVQRIIENPIDSIDTKFVSGERYFTEKLKEACKRLGISYSKSSLNRCFVDICCIDGTNCSGIVRDRTISKIDRLIDKMPIDLSKIYIGGVKNTSDIDTSNKRIYRLKDNTGK